MHQPHSHRYKYRHRHIRVPRTSAWDPTEHLQMHTTMEGLCLDVYRHAWASRACHRGNTGQDARAIQASATGYPHDWVSDARTTTPMSGCVLGSRSARVRRGPDASATQTLRCDSSTQMRPKCPDATQTSRRDPSAQMRRNNPGATRAPRCDAATGRTRASESHLPPRTTTPGGSATWQ